VELTRSWPEVIASLEVQHGRERARTGRRTLAAAIAALALAAASWPAPASAGPVPGITAFDAGSAAQLVKFASVNCRFVSLTRAGRVFERELTITGIRAGWRLVAVASAYSSGRRTPYQIPRGTGPPDNYFSLRGPTGTYNNISKPAGAILPRFGGAITATGTRPHQVGVGFINGWNLGATRAVTIAGVAHCVWLPPLRRGT
jgi:hypothetical protein